MKDNKLKGMMFILLFIALILQTLITNAQSYRGNSESPYKGFVATFGTRALDLNSNIEKIHETSLLQTGGQIGFIYGNGVVRSKIGLLGYYSSTGNTSGTTDLYESNVAFNFYPLSLISGNSLMVEPYITGGLDYDQYKFYGYYLNQEPGQINYSQAEAPYLGKVKQVNASMGVGIEVRLKDRFDFIHLFSEFKYGHNLSTKTNDAAFTGTELNNQSQVTVGISFGAHR